MTFYEKFKPNLIPNSKVNDPIDLEEIVGDNVGNYIISAKKDGCRVVFKEGKILTRALKPVLSTWIQRRYSELSSVCHKYGIILEGEFYSHDMKFNEIVRYFKTEDVTAESNVSKLRKLELAGKLDSEWPGRSVEWLSTYHDSLQIWLFDFIAMAAQDMLYADRINWLQASLRPGGIFYEFRDIVKLGPWYNTSTPSINTYAELKKLYADTLEDGYEGLVLANKNRTYKFSRSTAREKSLFKMKEDKLEFDGKVIDIVEGTIAREGAPKTTNELGRSVTSKLQEDRELSGLAKGILTEYEGHTLVVSLEGFTHANLRDILERKNEYIGQWFRYTGMAPVKNVPRHAHASKHNMWRDEK